MSFRLHSDPTDTHARYLPVSSITATAGDVLELDAGATTWTAANSASLHWQQLAVLIENCASGATEVKGILVNPNQIWEADASNNSDSSHNGDRMSLDVSGSTVVVNSGSDVTGQSAMVVQIAPVGATGDANILVKFLNSQGVDPDAA